MKGILHTSEPDEISPELIAVIERLPAEVPENFRKRATIVARYIFELDAADSVDNGKRSKFVTQLLYSGFIGLVYVRDRLRATFPFVPEPRYALPPWLYQELNADAVNKPAQQIKPKFVAWAEREKLELKNGPNGNYYKMSDKPESLYPARKFKYYLEGTSLEDAFELDKFSNAMNELKQNSLNPHQIKLFEEDRLVLYFDLDIDESNKISEIFGKYGLILRGPAQDVFQIDVNNDNSLKLKFITSNDGALGDGGHSPVDYSLSHYNPAEFLNNYLRLCLWAGKAPDEPYRISFVWLIDKEGIIKNPASVIDEARNIAQYPILYARNRLAITIPSQP